MTNDGPLPQIGAPATRALAARGITRLADLTHHRSEDLFAAPTMRVLRRRDELIVCVDVAHRGLGTASCGPDVLPSYRLGPGRYELVYRLSLRRR